MIQEIVNFTQDLIEDIPDILLRNTKPSNGLHIFVEIDPKGNWKNKPPRYGIDYIFYNGENEQENMLSELTEYESYGKRVGTSMNKVLCKKKQLFSCSPYIVSFKKKSFINDKLEGTGCEKITNLFSSYFDNAREICLKKADETLKQLSRAFQQVCREVLENIHNFSIDQWQKDGTTNQVSAFEIMKDDFYVTLYLKNISTEQYKKAHENYLKEKLFNDNSYNSEKQITNKTYGLSNFLNGLNAKKPFFEHKTAALHKGISGRIRLEDAIALNHFEILLSNRVLPNPLPIVVDNRELNGEIIRLFNSEGESVSYRQILNKLFVEFDREYLPDFYLIHYSKAKEIKINDFDFVPLFRYYLEGNNEIRNLTEAKFESDSDIKLATIFDFERIVVRKIFNNSLVKIKQESYSAHYFGDIDPTYVSGGDMMYQQIMKYRKAFYEFIYKSRRNAINTNMFDDMMYHSILSNIQSDEIKGSFSWHNAVKEKLNIWFSLYNLFNNNLKENEMASKVPDLMSKIRSVAKGEANFETSEDFAFGAGQLVSYLIDRSVATNKTYAMLEPYLQKNKSNQLQDAIAQTIAVYKHDISVYKGKFERLAAEVLIDNSDTEMKPLMKYFLAGCFCPCVIYESEKNKETTN